MALVAVAQKGRLAALESTVWGPASIAIHALVEKTQAILPINTDN